MWRSEEVAKSAKRTKGAGNPAPFASHSCAGYQVPLSLEPLSSLEDVCVEQEHS